MREAGKEPPAAGEGAALSGLSRQGTPFPGPDTASRAGADREDWHEAGGCDQNVMIRYPFRMYAAMPE